MTQNTDALIKYYGNPDYTNLEYHKIQFIIEAYIPKAKLDEMTVRQAHDLKEAVSAFCNSIDKIEMKEQIRQKFVEQFGTNLIPEITINKQNHWFTDRSLF